MSGDFHEDLPSLVTLIIRLVRNPRIDLGQGLTQVSGRVRDQNFLERDDDLLGRPFWAERPWHAMGATVPGFHLTQGRGRPMQGINLPRQQTDDIVAYLQSLSRAQ